MGNSTTLIKNYQNGNCNVNIYDDGTRSIEWPKGELKSPVLPFNMDIKITNFCDSTAGCMLHCHEKSNPSGQHSDLEKALDTLSDYPKGAELALGGGATQSHPDLRNFLIELKNKEIIANLTVNQFHFEPRYYDLLNGFINDGLIRGIGCSVTNENFDNIKPVLENSASHLVFHLIIGVHSIEIVESILNKFGKARILLLGYKQFGNGVNYYSKRQKAIDDNIYKWYTQIYKLFKKSGLTLSFDNLAIDQLNVKRLLREDDWNLFYQGQDEGLESGSMYIDLVKGEYSHSSRHPSRYEVGNLKVKEMFANLKANYETI